MPSECVRYWIVPGGEDSPAGWNQLLSFAACTQDASVEQIDDAAQLPGLVDRYVAQLKPTMLWYLGAVEQGPPPIQLRAVYQIGIAELALMVRARSSIVVPPDRATNRRAAAHYRELHDRLEPLLARAAHVAMVSFAAVEQAAASDPACTPDAMTAGLVRSAHRLRLLLQRDWPGEAVPDFLLTASP